MAQTHHVTVESLPDLLKNDHSVKVAGCDVDGILRGKLMSKAKFLSVAKDGLEFGFCSVIFGWDMHDKTYFQELKISNKENGYRDIVAHVDLTSFRRIPWENNIPFFLCSFREPEGQSLSACPRSLLRHAADQAEKAGVTALAGAEYEFYQFKVPQQETRQSDNRTNTSSTAVFLQQNSVHDLPSLTEGMFGYSLTRPMHNQDYYYGIFDACQKFGCGIESWHSESGPGVFEAALEYDEVKSMADKSALFKLAVKSIGSNYGITPCFMAKPRAGLPGNSGHVHISLIDAKTKHNLFCRDPAESDKATFSDAAHLSDLGMHFLAGLLDGLPDVMPLIAPTINSYKRLVENFWAPVTVSWGLEHRAASIRLIAPASKKGTRFEFRVAGADANPYLVLATILALGWRGVEMKLDLTMPPLGKGEDVGGASDKGTRLAKTLKEANERFRRQGSIAREVFGDDFVDHYAGTREHEVRLYEEAVTDWEVKRYIETV